MLGKLTAEKNYLQILPIDLADKSQCMFLDDTTFK